MGLYDILDDISERQAVKTETGDNRIYGVMVGIVAENVDKNSSKAGGEGSNSGENAMDGRVCVNILTRGQSGQTNGNQLLWARVAMPSSGSDWGHYFLPEVGDQVLLAFEGGNIEKPYVIGCVPKTKGFPNQYIDKDNAKKAIVTRNGNKLIFTDVKTEDRNEDQILLETGGQTFTILMDNKENTLAIRDKDKNNYIEMKTGDDGTITIEAKNKMVLKVGDIEISLNGGNGTMTVNAKNVDILSKENMKLKSDKSFSVESATYSTTVNTSMTMECTSGTATFKGATTNVGG